MARLLVSLAVAGTAAAACAPVSAPVSHAPGALRPLPHYQPPPPLAEVRGGELRLCGGASARNAGRIGPRGEVMLFSAAIATPAGPLWRNPTDGGCLSSAYGWRPRASGGGRNHLGIDFARPRTKRIFAAGSGVVTHSGWRGGYGLTVTVHHGRGVETLYAHLDPKVAPPAQGVRVRQGDVIGRMGSTGRSTGVHLHYEVRVRGRAVDPLRAGAPPALSAFMGEADLS